MAQICAAADGTRLHLDHANRGEISPLVETFLFANSVLRVCPALCRVVRFLQGLQKVFSRKLIIVCLLYVYVVLWLLKIERKNVVTLAIEFRYLTSVLS